MKIIPETVGIYRAERDGEIIEGTAREISEKTGIHHEYVRKLAKKPGFRTRDGWTVTLITGAVGIRDNTREYLAECPGEDPIIGPASEIAALTGMPSGTIWHLITTGKASRDGWTVKEAPKEGINER